MFVALAAVTMVIYTTSAGNAYVLGYWGFGCAVLVWGLTSHLAGGGRYADKPVPAGRVLAIIPAYNESEAGLVAGIDAILGQTIDCDIIVVDDGSANPVVGYEHPRVRWMRQDNAGKRAAQVTALRSTRRGDYDFILTVDSDSAPYPDALEHLLRAMSDPEVWAATGWVYTRNYRDNWVARCADLDIGIAMVMNRSSRTQIGSIETMSGALALYRADLLWDHAEDYLLDTVGAGDDRWLTARALLRGKAVGVNEAIVETDMPTEVARTYKQRVRWSKSTYLMAGFSISRYRLVQLIPPLISFIYIVTAPMSLAALLVAGLFAWRHGTVIGTLAWQGVAVLFVTGFLTKIVLCGLYLLRRKNMPRRQKLLSLLAGASLLYVFGVFAITLPKYAALFKLRDVRWSTREIEGHTVMVPVDVAGERRLGRGGRRHRPEDFPPLEVLDGALGRMRSGIPMQRHRIFDPEETAVVAAADFVASRPN